MERIAGTRQQINRPMGLDGLFFTGRTARRADVMRSARKRKKKRNRPRLSVSISIIDWMALSESISATFPSRATQLSAQPPGGIELSIGSTVCLTAPCRRSDARSSYDDDDDVDYAIGRSGSDSRFRRARLLSVANGSCLLSAKGSSLSLTC